MDISNVPPGKCLCTCDEKCNGGAWVHPRTYSRHQNQDLSEGRYSANLLQDINQRYGARKSAVSFLARMRRPRKRSSGGANPSRRLHQNTTRSVSPPSPPLSPCMPPADAQSPNLNTSDSEDEVGHAGQFDDVTGADRTEDDHDDEEEWEEYGEEDDEDEDEDDDGDGHEENIDAVDRGIRTDFPSEHPPRRTSHQTEPLPRASLNNLTLVQDMIEAIQAGRLEDDIKDSKLLDQILNPSPEVAELSPLSRLSIDIFIALTNGSQQMYNDVKEALQRFDERIILDSYFVS
ncbi:hypothetical protein M378DRAFT_180059 [Amanita muscaria Koide BX008]|uniref:Uncharacterized protein n=1 Tax=Amanita muscaria (strain Koide BX008) TaxID=946122 RepID=A0A0C2T4T8_AMAMK|nr:hypothetical protein M378DRAFT_180059 [Amanita muscaria Koide BX008]